MNLSVADLRQNYTRDGLSEANASPNPIEQFSVWLEQALSAQLPEPNAMTLATVTPQGQPSARMVLLKGFDARGFVFFTNYESNKGQQLRDNPCAALVFWWAELERQVRIEGGVEKLSSQDSDRYFHSRPFGSRLGAWASDQSQVIASRQVLEERLAKLVDQYQDAEVPRPDYWGGFRVIPQVIEFWQGRPSRLHDRLRYRLVDNNAWVRERLSP